MADPARQPAGHSGPAAKQLQQAEVLAVTNLEFFRDYSVLEDFETLQAIDKLESQQKDF